MSLANSRTHFSAIASTDSVCSSGSVPLHTCPTVGGGTCVFPFTKGKFNASLLLPEAISIQLRLFHSPKCKPILCNPKKFDKQTYKTRTLERRFGRLDLAKNIEKVIRCAAFFVV